MAFRVRYRPNLSFVRNPIPNERRVAARQGALIRTIARRSIRKRKRPSNPGDPPTSRTGLLKNFLFYSWDPSTQSVVVGPEKLFGVSSVDAPEALEFGGTSRDARGRRLKIEARPFMAPALDQAKSKLPELWKGAVN